MIPEQQLSPLQFQCLTVILRDVRKRLGGDSCEVDRSREREMAPRRLAVIVRHTTTNRVVCFLNHRYPYWQQVDVALRCQVITSVGEENWVPKYAAMCGIVGRKLDEIRRTL